MQTTFDSNRDTCRNPGFGALAQHVWTKHRLQIENPALGIKRNHLGPQGPLQLNVNGAIHRYPPEAPDFNTTPQQEVSWFNQLSSKLGPVRFRGSFEEAG